MTRLYIKNMVCSRCIMVVKSELEAFGFHPISVALGEVAISETITKDQKQEINKKLLAFGFELIDDKRSRIVEKVKTLIVDLVHSKNNSLQINLSDYLVDSINQDYSHISNLFSQVEGTTIEQYYILQKIERVKELLVYDELSLNEIAFQLKYSSASHLSKQFKKVTGLTVTHFRNLKNQKRNPLENL